MLASINAYVYVLVWVSMEALSPRCAATIVESVIPALILVISSAAEN